MWQFELVFDGSISEVEHEVHVLLLSSFSTVSAILLKKTKHIKGKINKALSISNFQAKIWASIKGIYCGGDHSFYPVSSVAYLQKKVFFFLFHFIIP